MKKVKMSKSGGINSYNQGGWGGEMLFYLLVNTAVITDIADLPARGVIIVCKSVHAKIDPSPARVTDGRQKKER